MLGNLSQSNKYGGRWSRWLHAFYAAVGYVLSPLSWWNDLVVNVPLAYLFAAPFAWLDARLYLPAFVLGYWLTNLAGMLLLHKGLVGVARPNRPIQRRNLILTTTLYSVAIGVAVWQGWLPSPVQWLN
jgi:hypothetical protein